MPASIRIAGTGCMVKVSGSSIEIAVRAPMPGRTPMRLPTSTPKNDHIRLCGWSATPKPYHRSISDCVMSPSPCEEREIHVERPCEHDDRENDHREREQKRGFDRVLPVAERRDENDCEGR